MTRGPTQTGGDEQHRRGQEFGDLQIMFATRLLRVPQLMMFVQR